jgi:hypothetical protein
MSDKLQTQDGANKELLSKSEIYNPRIALAPALLPNMKYKFPNGIIKITRSKGKRTSSFLLDFLVCKINQKTFHIE